MILNKQLILLLSTILIIEYQINGEDMHIPVDKCKVNKNFIYERKNMMII